MSIATQVEALWNGLVVSDGTPLEGGKVYAYEAGTTTQKTLYTAQDKSEEATFPLVLDSNGRAKVWADGNYKFVITDKDDVAFLTIDGLIYGKENVRNTWCGLSTGGPNDFIVGATPPIEMLNNGDIFSFIANDTNTSDGDPDIATLKINSLEARTIKTTAGAHIAAGDIDAGAIITVIYNLASDTFILDLGSLTPAYSDVTISSLTASSIVASDASKRLVAKTASEARDLLELTSMATSALVSESASQVVIDAGNYDLNIDGETIYGSADLALNLGKSDKRYYTFYSKNIADNSSSVIVGGDLGLPAAKALYSGDGVTEGDWRHFRSGNDWILQRYESGSFVTKSTILAAKPNYTVSNPTTLRSFNVAADISDLAKLTDTVRYLMQFVGTMAIDLIADNTYK